MLTVTTTNPDPDEMVRQASLSDLFFNWDAPAYTAFMTNDSEGNDGDGREELLKDAEEFAACLERATGVKLVPAELVEDYFARV